MNEIGENPIRHERMKVEPASAVLGVGMAIYLNAVHHVPVTDALLVGMISGAATEASIKSVRHLIQTTKNRFGKIFGHPEDQTSSKPEYIDARDFLKRVGTPEDVQVRSLSRAENTSRLTAQFQSHGESVPRGGYNA